MDTSSHDLQASVLAHVFDGVRIDDLTAQQRVDALWRLVEIYIKGWGGNPPGFTPVEKLGPRAANAISSQGGIGWNQRVLCLAHVPQRRPITRGRPDGTARTFHYRLLLNDKGKLLLEVQSSGVGSLAPHRCRLKLCGSRMLLMLMQEPQTLRDVTVSLKREARDKRAAAQSHIRKADSLLEVLDRLA